MLTGLLLIVSLLAADPPASPTNDPANSESVKSPEITAEQLEALIESLKKSPDADKEPNTTLLSIYEQTLLQVQAAENWAVKSEKYDTFIESISGNLKKAKEELALIPKDPQVQVPSDLSVDDLKSKLDKMKTDLDSTKQNVEKLANEAQDRETSQLAFPDLETESKKELDGLSSSSSPKADQEDPKVKEARRLAVWSRKSELQNKISALQLEQKSNEEGKELYEVQMDLASKQVTNDQIVFAAWQAVYDQRRQAEADQDLQEAKEVSEKAPPEILELAKENEDLVRLRAELIKKLSGAEKEKNQIDSTLAEITNKQVELKAIVDVISNSGVIGALLQQQRANLPDINKLKQSLAQNQQAIKESQYQSFEYKDQQRELAQLDESVKEALDQLDLPENSARKTFLEEEAKKLLSDRKEILDSLIEDLKTYRKNLLALNLPESQLISEVRQLDQYIAERIPWIQSTLPIFNYPLTSQSKKASEWLLSPDSWEEALLSIIDDPVEHSAIVFGFILLLVWLYYKSSLKSRLIGLGHKVSKDYTRTTEDTFQALALTMILSIGWPAAVWLIGVRLTSSSEANEFGLALGWGLQVIASVFLMTEIVRQVSRPEGLADMHFRWRQTMLVSLRRNLLWFVPLWLPWLLIVVMLDSQNDQELSASLGRVCFLVVMLLLGIFVYRVLRPSGLVMQEIIGGHRGSWLERWKNVWFLIAMGTPVFLSGLAITGYYYTALLLANRFQISFALIMFLVLLNALVVRWLFAARGRLAKDRVQEKSALVEEAEKENAPPDVRLADIPFDMSEINTQTKQLLRSVLGLTLFVGFWIIWSDTLPALGVLKNVELWSQVQQVTTFKGNEDGTGSGRMVTEDLLVPTTLADLCLAILIGFFTVVASTNVPGLLEITVLKRIPLNMGGHYAAKILARYIITSVGIVLGFFVLGIGWSNVQWLIAAMGVGLGFGLQEIFANFVSGLIILFEQPIRVGDIVTVDGVSGVVTRIRMRATTIRNWDKKDFIVPNKEFITGKLLNWTLTDHLNRVVINIGIAYGSDTEQAKELLIESARSNPIVLDDPGPVASFEGFGDNCLDFVLRAYLPNLDNRLSVIHDLHTRIDLAFRKDEIEISFPQRDLHIRSIDPSITSLSQSLGKEGK